MQKEDQKLKHRYLAQIAGPILFTAPHSKKVYRGGETAGQERREHLRQMYTSYLAVDFACEIPQYVKMEQQSGSFCIWGEGSAAEEDIDPNYLTGQQYFLSPFHLALHEFQAANIETPLFHVDIHGKGDRQHNCQLDIGVMSMKALWPEDDLYKHIQADMTKNFDAIFEGMKIGKFQPKAQPDPFLHGYWGTNVATMSTQGVQLGIPSIQLQIPRAIRFLTNFLQVIAGTYNKVIVPLWQRKKYPLAYNLECRGKIDLLRYSKKEIVELSQQIDNMEKAAELK